MIDSEAGLRRVIEGAPIAMIVVDAQGRMKIINAAALAIFGYAHGELLGQSIDMLVPAESRAGHAARRDEFQVSDQPSRAMGVGREVRGVRKDGTEVALEIGLRRIPETPTPFVVASIIDITQRQAAESRHRQELTRSNEELEQFASMASHDLQEPLRAVTGCIQILQRRYQGQLDPKADELIAHAVDGVKRMQSLIDGLLGYARVGRAGMALEPVDCNHALETALKNLASAIRDSGAVIDAGPLPILDGHLTQLTLLFQNLIGNALKFRREGTVPTVKVSARRQASTWTIAVADNGIGIAAKDLDRIFGAFQRLHSRRQFSGSGLGLAICKRIVEAHGGRIWVESVEPQGSTFFARFPLSARPSDVAGSQPLP